MKVMGVNRFLSLARSRSAVAVLGFGAGGVPVQFWREAIVHLMRAERSKS